ncbi:hypothetical protein MJO29_011890 [Puccinia striiformis f. sp. tritici]|nr:hypothetical protein Pst134EA_022568 [Puccinia striiformis f. sp. tritici]KAI9605727.1 hypothetical protein H4Q26_004092 [Puccinia striiformis f. sp. tritici PST-130]KNF01566.1 hypothetical protein PSTG_05344 [Puccinia striiformis f. sp. tritici PST-78]KAH9445618.1 hypothetical protein Pst134EB_023454 [Puccinia striiformis f. sp. tritici]KAH9455092.1 hypothetical protein Pst134EA_022568 [Puccinia striiformis f. sp. tritici]KAI7945502.1 hypothetical protein MJO29_011890 [Puccinia striiformis
MLSGPIHPNYVFPAPPTRTKRSASIHDHNHSKRLHSNGKRRTAILSFSSHASKAVDLASYKGPSSKQQNSQENDSCKRDGRSFYTKLYSKFKAVTTSSISSKLTHEEIQPSQIVINRSQSCTSHGSVNSPGHLSAERHRAPRPLVMKVDNSQIIYISECCVHCNHKCENKLDPTSAHEGDQLYGLRDPIGRKSVQTFDQFFSSVDARDSSLVPPPIPWQTRPKPTRPFRPRGEYDEELVKLNVSNQLPHDVPSSPTDKPDSAVSNQTTIDRQTIRSFQNTLQALEFRKSDGYTTPRTRLFSTFSEPTTAASPALSTSQRLEDILGSNDYGLPNGENYIFSSNFNSGNDLLNFSSTKNTSVMSFPGRTADKKAHQTRPKREFRPTRPTQSWNPSPHLVFKRRESAVM